MEEKKVLTEENYEKSRNKIKKLALIIFIVGLVVGGLLIIIGVVQVKNNSKNIIPTTSEVSKTSSSEDDSVQNKIDKLESENETLENEIADLEIAQDMEFEKNGFSQTYNDYEKQINTKEKKVFKNEEEMTKLKFEQDDSNFNAEANAGFNKVFSLFGGSVLIVLGISILSTLSLVALGLFIWSKKREIVAYGTQSVMPVAKEGIDEISPNIGNAAKEISKGIKEGISESNNEEPKTENTESVEETNNKTEE